MRCLLPAAAIAGALALGAPSAQAATGSLAFSDGTSDFFSLVPDVPVAGDMFSVTFNPTSQVAVNVNTGLFNPPFTGVPIYLETTVGSSAATFTYTGAANIWEIEGDTSFVFTNGATVGINDNVQFLVIKGGGAVEVALLNTLPPADTAFVSGLSVPVTVVDGAFTFNDTEPSGGGSYSSNIDVAADVEVPGPLPILGAGVAFGYSRRLRKRIKVGVSA